MMQMYAKHSLIAGLIVKFLAAFFMLLAINSKAGYVKELTALPITLLVSLVCCILPWGMITGIMCIVLLIHFMKISFIVALVALIIMIVMILINLIFAPGCQAVVFFVPMMFFLKLPFLLPLVLGLVAPVTVILPMLFGILLYFLMDYVNSMAGFLADVTDTAGMSARFIQLIDGLRTNRVFMILAVAFAVTVVIVYVIHRLSIDYAWLIAIAAGAVANLVLVLLGVASSSGNTADLTVVSVICSSIVSVLLAYVIQFMVFAVDYKQTEYAQCEDDEYYYYIKAVPKVRVAEKEYDKIDILTGDESKQESGEQESE
ncbi:MAG: hypothetical protein Q4F21_03560 [Lachnospiraceae bacterium]|nr:hypothetical protein [Lachnospiraceae bacterium]